MEATFCLINRLGIDQDTLTSGNAILPIAYYLCKTGQGDLSTSTPENARNARLIQRWLIGSLLNGVFGGTSDSTLGAARVIIKESLRDGNDFPYRTLVDGLAQRGRLTEFDEITSRIFWKRLMESGPVFWRCRSLRTRQLGALRIIISTTSFRDR